LTTRVRRRQDAQHPLTMLGIFVPAADGGDAASA
jgi:hypothetical protein